MRFKTDKYIYVTEIKLGDTAGAALEQIESKDYAAGFADDKRQIIKIGASFNKQTRRLGEWKVSVS